MSCEVAGCEEQARGRFCEVHRKRRQRGQPLDAPVQARGEAARRRAEEELLEAALAVGGMDTERAADGRFQAAWERLLSAARALPRDEGTNRRLSPAVCEHDPS